MQLTEVDSGYSWIVAGSSFFLYMMMYGAYRLSGILFIASMPRYGVGREAASFPYTFAGFTKNVGGPVVGIMLHKFRIRTLILSGCTLATIGIATCFFAENIFVVTVLWGVVYGFGFAMATALLPVLINQYFVRHRATAAGIAFSGMCVGSMIFPPLVEICIEYYGISGTFFIIAGLVLNCLPLAIFLKSRIPEGKDENKVQKRSSTNPDDFIFLQKESQNFVQKKSYINDTEKTPLLASIGQTKQNGFLYSSVSEQILVASNKKIEDSSIVKNQAVLGENIKDDLLISKIIEPRILSESEHQSSLIIDNKHSNERDEVGELIIKYKDNESDMKSRDVLNERENQTQSIVVNTTEDSNTDETNDSCMDTSTHYMSKSQNLSNVSNELCNLYKSDQGKLEISSVISKVQETTDLNEKETACDKQLPEKDDAMCKDSKNYDMKSDTLNDTKDGSLFQIRGNTKTFDGETTSGDISFSPIIASQRNRKKKIDHKSLIKVYPDTTIVIVPDNSDENSKPNNELLTSASNNKSICKGNCSLLLNFTYLVVVFTKTLSNSISLCVNTVIFDYARDIGIATENEKYILVFSSMGELLGRLTLGRVADINCLSNPMLLVICSVGQGLGALAIAWSTSFYFLSAGLFVYAFMGSVVQFMMPIIVADGIEEERQAFAITSSSFLAGPASLLISPLIGYLRDEIGTYTYLFYGIGALCGLTAIIWLIGYFTMKPKTMYAKLK